MGWFGVKMKIFIKIIRFSSPLGDGLVPQKASALLRQLAVFVPEWGWVGSPPI